MIHFKINKQTPELSEKLAALIQEWSSRNIRQDSYERVKGDNWSGAVLAYRKYAWIPFWSGHIVGFSLWGKNDLSLTVIDQKFRKLGLASSMLSMKPVNRTVVAASNIGSVKMCLNAGFVLTDARADNGRYNPVLIFERPNLGRATGKKKLLEVIEENVKGTASTNIITGGRAVPSAPKEEQLKFDMEVHRRKARYLR